MNNQIAHKYYVTFGQRYRYEPHPTYRKAHPDGYIEIRAFSEEHARRIAFNMLEDKWSNIYTEEEFASSLKFYPLGALTVVNATLSELPSEARLWR